MAIRAKREKRVYRGPVLLESEIEQACTKYLHLDGWRGLKTNPVSDRKRGAGFGEKGMADYLYLRYLSSCITNLARVEVMWVEWKRIDAKGKTTKAAAHQREWIARERARGALVLLAGEDFPATIDGFMAWYRDSGLRRMVR
jgi:hypothetical protein